MNRTLKKINQISHRTWQKLGQPPPLCPVQDPVCSVLGGAYTIWVMFGKYFPSSPNPEIFPAAISNHSFSRQSWFCRELTPAGYWLDWERNPAISHLQTFLLPLPARRLDLDKEDPCVEGALPSSSNHANCGESGCCQFPDSSSQFKKKKIKN